MSLIGLDIGTTGCKAIVFSVSGEILGQAAREYPILTPHPTGRSRMRNGSGSWLGNH